ncbi:MAG: hypothetical protein DMF45_00435 [Verrucomicrobia bacterium]|nr:MAG: hypothetical protein DMF45_00435 [Verrucomicrobiota bacterium]
MKMGIFGNGTSLVENLVPSGLANVATRLVEAIAINSISEKARRGRTLVVKRRNIHSEQLECWSPRRLSFVAPTDFGVTNSVAAGPTAMALPKTYSTIQKLIARD